MHFAAETDAAPVRRGGRGSLCGKVDAEAHTSRTRCWRLQWRGARGALCGRRRWDGACESDAVVQIRVAAGSYCSADGGDGLEDVMRVQDWFTEHGETVRYHGTVRDGNSNDGKVLSCSAEGFELKKEDNSSAVWTQNSKCYLLMLLILKNEAFLHRPIHAKLFLAAVWD